MIPILKTSLPSAQEICEFLEQIDRNQIYSNFGPLYCRFVEEIGSLYGVSGDNVVACSSGTSGLQLALLEIAERSSKKAHEITVAVPNWTFQATAQAVLSLGMKLMLFDVDDEGVIDKSCLEKSADIIDIIIVVAPFGMPIDYRQWEKYAEKMRKELIFDAAASIFTLKATTCSSVISTHATKGISTGEGGLVVVKDDQKAKRIKAIGSFGFQGYRRSDMIGMNAKISEYGCAVGLAMLKKRKQVEDRLMSLATEYDDAFNDPCVEVAKFSKPPFARSTYSVRLKMESVDNVIPWFSSRGIEVRSWWGTPLSDQPLGRFCDYVSVDNKMTKSLELSNTVVGIPFGTHITKEDAKHIISSVKMLSKQL
jgi:dTDP-4-amino-4,6-dideoxygalactose transaminase